jgi:hypothetical protein
MQLLRHVPFTTPGLMVLAWQGGRAELSRHATSQIKVINQQYRAALTFSNENYYRGLGDQIATMLEAADARRGGALGRSTSTGTSSRFDSGIPSLAESSQ